MGGEGGGDKYEATTALSSPGHHAAEEPIAITGYPKRVKQI